MSARLYHCRVLSTFFLYHKRAVFVYYPTNTLHMLGGNLKYKELKISFHQPIQESMMPSLVPGSFYVLTSTYMSDMTSQLRPRSKTVKIPKETAAGRLKNHIPELNIVMCTHTHYIIHFFFIGTTIIRLDSLIFMKALLRTIKYEEWSV